MSADRARLLFKLSSAWETTPPETALGALIEAVEDCAWDSLPARHCSARLLNMPDWLLERGVDIWMRTTPKPAYTSWPL